jgi:hypothetical protein
MAYVATIFSVFAYARRYATAESTPWLAATAFALGGYSIEYAMGLWPHALSMALAATGAFATGRSIESGSRGFAAGAGLLLGLAAGVRYQNVVVLTAGAVALVLWHAHRKRALLVFALAAALPLTASSAINHARLGSWNPISKGPGYLDVPLVTDARTSLSDPFVMTWARVVDFSVRPRLTSRAFETWLTHDPQTGAHLIQGVTLKKALLQSAPWVIVPLLLFLMVWFRRSQVPGAARRQVQVLSLVTAAVLGMFAVAGVGRDDGMSYNQRYLLELLPLLAVGLGWALDGLLPRSRWLAFGGVLGAAAVLTILAAASVSSGDPPRLGVRTQMGLLRVPLILAGSLAVAWMLARTGRRVGRTLALTTGMCLGWGLALHMADDTLASHRVRRYNMQRTAALASVLGDNSALVAYWWHKDPAIPLLFDRDIVVLDARADDGNDAPMLVRELLGQGRRVFLLEDGFPPAVMRRVLMGLQASPVGETSLRMLELRLKPA